MAATGGTPIILYHSTTASAVPSNTNLAAGELGLNIADMKLYCENDSAVVTLLASADAAAGNFTTVDTTNLEVTNIKAKDGTASATITDSTGAFTISTELSVDNININGNTIVSSDTDGDLNLTPNGTGDLVLDGLNWPQADGSADYVLKTNGSGQLSWTAQTGGGGGGGTSVTVTQVTATASQTTFNVTYTVGQLSVYLNGALLASADFTATNGTTVVLASGAASGDIFTALAYDSATQITEGDSSVVVTDSGTGKVEVTVDNVEVADFTTGAIVFNETGANQDFRVEGDTDANLLFVDASAEAVGIGSTVESGSKLTVKNAGIAISRDGEAVFMSSAYDIKIRSASPTVGIHATAGSQNMTLEFSGGNGANAIIDVVSNDGLVFRTNNLERARITSGGDLLLGTTSDLYGSTRLQATDDSSAGSFTFQGTAGNAGYEVGQIWKTNTSGDNKFLAWITEGGAGTERGSVTYNRAGNLVSYNTSSDYRLKENIIDLTDALETVARLQPRQFTWKETGNTTTGFIAHELAEVLPHAVTGTKDEVRIKQVEVSAAVPATYDENGNELTPAVEAIYEEHEVPVYQGVDTSFLVATLTAAIQELSAKNNALEARIAALEAQIANQGV